jgi:hypothetical protein
MMNIPGTLMWAVGAGLIVIYAVATFTAFSRHIASNRWFSAGLILIFVAFLFVGELVTPKFSPRTTVMGRVVDVNVTQDRDSRSHGTLLLDVGGGAFLRLSYDADQETFGPTQMIHVTYTDWDDHIRVVRPLWQPDTEVLSEERDRDAAYRPYEILGALALGAVFIALSLRRGDAADASDAD